MTHVGTRPLNGSILIAGNGTSASSRKATDLSLGIASGSSHERDSNR
jgi:hypothetical protein